jgi:hypothetical protein
VVIKLVAQPEKIKPELISSINAAHTPEEIIALVRETALRGTTVDLSPMGFVIMGEKAG